MMLASEVEDVHYITAVAVVKGEVAEQTETTTYLCAALVNGMVHTQSLSTLTKHLINQLQTQGDGYLATLGTAASSSSTVPSDVTHDGHGCNSEVIKCMCCCDHPVVRARMCNFVVIIQLFVHTWFVFL